MRYHLLSFKLANILKFRKDVVKQALPHTLGEYLKCYNPFRKQLDHLYQEP